MNHPQPHAIHHHLSSSGFSSQEVGNRSLRHLGKWTAELQELWSPPVVLFPLVTVENNKNDKLISINKFRTKLSSEPLPISNSVLTKVHSIKKTSGFGGISKLYIVHMHSHCFAHKHFVSQRSLSRGCYVFFFNSNTNVPSSCCWCWIGAAQDESSVVNSSSNILTDPNAASIYKPDSETL